MSDETLVVPERRRIRYLRDQRLRELGFSTYDEYVHSSCWIKTRRRFYRANPDARCICGAESPLVLHHKTYERVGAERLADLVALCPECHFMVHELESRGDNGLDVEAILDGVCAARNRAQELAKAAERDEAQAGFRTEFKAKLEALPLDRRIALAERAALTRHISISTEAFKARAVLRAGRPPEVVARWVNALETKAYERELGGGAH